MIEWMTKRNSRYSIFILENKWIKNRLSNMFTSFFSIILEFIGYAIYWIPRKIQMNLGSFLGWILYQLHFRLTIVQNNLQFAFPGDVQKKKRSLMHLINI